ncbi:MAG: HAD family hydrolase, partial [Thermoplasmata archaeon]
MDRAAVIMDWYGVIGDREETSKKYRVVYASLLRSRFGGSLGRWLKAHDLAFEWYVTEWQRLYEESRNGSELGKDLDARAVRKAVEKAGLQLDSADASRLATQLEYDIASEIGSVYPDVVSSLKKIKDMQIDIYIATDVSSDHLKGLLKSSGLEDLFSNGLTPDLIGARKSDDGFWRRVFERVGVPPESCLVVDDAGPYLRRAKRSGASTVCVERKKPSSPLPGKGFKPDYTIESLKELPRILKEKLMSVED